jgi:hypothetical protein
MKLFWNVETDWRIPLNFKSKLKKATLNIILTKVQLTTNCENMVLKHKPFGYYFSELWIRKLLQLKVV